MSVIFCDIIIITRVCTAAGGVNVGRPAKPIDLADGRRTNEVKRRRKAAEEKLKGQKPPDLRKIQEGLSRQQKAIAADIVRSMEDQQLLCSLDTTVIKLAAFAIDGIRACIKEQNDTAKAIADGDIPPESECMNDPNFRQKLKKYEETFDRACKELGLSPQARAKIAIAGTTGKDDSLAMIKEIIGGDTAQG